MGTIDQQELVSSASLVSPQLNVEARAVTPPALKAHRGDSLTKLRSRPRHSLGHQEHIRGLPAVQLGQYGVNLVQVPLEPTFGHHELQLPIRPLAARSIDQPLQR